jgi:hypothetical protein
MASTHLRRGIFSGLRGLGKNGRIISNCSSVKILWYIEKKIWINAYALYPYFMLTQPKL